jgi:hypothetical protein
MPGSALGLYVSHYGFIESFKCLARQWDIKAHVLMKLFKCLAHYWKVVSWSNLPFVPASELIT